MSTTKTTTPNTARWTLAKYVDEIFTPTRLEGGTGSRGAISYRQYVGLFAKWVGHDVKLREITPEMVEEYERYCVRTGCKPKTARERVYTLRAIMRLWRPEDEAWAPWRRPAGLQRHFQEVDVQGSLEQVFQDHYLAENLKISTKRTIAAYGRCLRTFGEFLGRPAMLGDLTDETLGRFLRTRVEVDGVKIVTANGEATKIRALWNWAAKKRLVEFAPTVSLLPEPEQVPRAWSRQDLARLFTACRYRKGLMGSVAAADYWIAFHYVLWDTGERTGAMLQLSWKMLETDTRHLVVPAEVRKGAKKAMTYKLKPPTVELLEKIREPKRELIFGHTNRGRVMHYTNFYAAYKRLLRAAGLPATRRDGPQRMRRTFASFIVAAGGDATAALRHCDRRTTEESYIDPTIARPLPANELLFDPMGKQK